MTKVKKTRAKKLKPTLEQIQAKLQAARKRRLSRMTEELAVQMLQDVFDFIDEHIISYDSLVAIEEIAQEIDGKVNSRMNASDDEEVE